LPIRESSKDKENVYIHNTLPLAEETRVDQRKDVEANIQEDRTSQKFHYILLLLVVYTSIYMSICEVTWKDTDLIVTDSKNSL